MPQIALKPKYGPTLGQILAPRWRDASRWLRALIIAAGLGLLAGLLVLGLTLLPASISYGGPVPFSFEYRDLYRTTPEPGGYMRVLRRKHGKLEDSLAVGPLVLPPYEGSLTAELPLYAAGYIKTLERRYVDFVLRGEGKTRVNTVPAYSVFYTARVEGQEVYGRDVLLLPERADARRGVDIVMLTSPHASSQVKSPSEVATAGPLDMALHSFSFD
jgi:hypothetical protein